MMVSNGMLLQLKNGKNAKNEWLFNTFEPKINQSELI